MYLSLAQKLRLNSWYSCQCAVITIAGARDGASMVGALFGNQSLKSIAEKPAVFAVRTKKRT